MLRIKSNLGYRTTPQLGAMVETPAAALCGREIAAVSDFLSVGTNDLTQYTMAAGRENELVSHYFLDNHPAVIKLLRRLIEEAGQTPVGVCGELAGRMEAVPMLAGLGFRMLSVAPALIPVVKETVRETR